MENFIRFIRTMDDEQFPIQQDELPLMVWCEYSNRIVKYSESEYGSNASDYYKRIEPWLCTFDIKVGDLVFALNEEEAGNVVDEEDLAHWKDIKQGFKLVCSMYDPSAVHWYIMEPYKPKVL